MNRDLSLSRQSNRRAGFTLVELLVVIGIIALLISILLPTLSSARRSSKSLACLSNQRQIGIGINQFAQEHDGWLPKPQWNDYPNPVMGRAFDTGKVDWGYRSPYWQWDYVLNQDGMDKNVFLCPSDPSEFIRGTNTPEDIDDFAASYRYNHSNQRYGFWGIKQNDLPDSTSAILIVDALPAQFYAFESSLGYHTGSYDQAKIGASDEQIGNTAPFRHDADGTEAGQEGLPDFKINAVFGDGHAESMRYQETWQPRGTIEFIQGGGDPRRVGDLAVGVRTMWRQLFEDGSRVDLFDNPYTDLDDSNNRP